MGKIMPASVLQQLAATSSTVMKKTILKSNQDETLQRVLLYALDPFRTYGLTSASLKDPLQSTNTAMIKLHVDDPLAWRYEGRLATSDEPILREVPRAEIWECPQVAIVDGHLGLVLSCWFQGVLGDVVWVMSGSMKRWKEDLEKIWCKIVFILSWSWTGSPRCCSRTTTGA